MYRISLCDDNVHQTDYLSDIIEAFLKSENIIFELDSYDSGEKLLEAMNVYDEHYQILFLDIQMAGINGIETARQIRERDKDILIIYLTSYDKYTLKSFEVSPFRYLMKPINETKIKEVLHLALQKINQDRQFFFFNVGKEKFQVRSHQIISAISTLGRKIALDVENEGTFEFYGKMSELESQLDTSSFVRISSSMLLNMAYIKYITPRNVIYLRNGTTCNVSRRRQQKFHEKYNQFIKKELIL